jgi:hypothetical protein
MNFIMQVLANATDDIKEKVMLDLRTVQKKLLTDLMQM